MNGVSSFGSNIESILGDILVKRSTIKELLNEIKNISVVNIEKSNSLVEKMLSITQVINERTNEIEKEYSNFISHKNSFSDLTYWEEKIYPEITGTFESELQEYLKQLLTLESICEKYFIKVIEDELASDDQRHLITKNPYSTTENKDTKDDYNYPSSVGYNWYSIKANDDYMTNSKSLLNISKYDKDKYIETNQINKSSILHETISFHPKYGLVHYLSLGRERTLSSIRDNETNSPVSTIEFKTFDGFNGEMNELKSHLDRNIFTNNATEKNKNDIKYQLLLRHNMDSNNGTSYFILKMRDYEPLENGIPSYYFINRNNLDTASITRSYSDTSTTKTFINPSIKDNSNDINLPDNDTIVKATTDTDEIYTPSKRLSEISFNNLYLNTSYLNIKGKEYNLIRKVTIKDSKDFIYNYDSNKPFVIFSTISKCNKPQNTNSRDLFSNLRLRIWGYPLINNNNSIYISFNGKYDSFKTLNYLDNYSKYQVSHKEFNKYHNITPLELNNYGLTDNSIVYNKTILERRIINNNNQNFDKFTSYTLEESYNLFNENNNKENSDYYYENYNKGITLYTARNDNTILPEITRNLQANTVKSYTDLPDYNLQDTSTQEHSVYIYGNDSSNNTNNKFNFKTLTNGYWPTNTMITYYCSVKNHVWAIGRNFNEIYYSEDSGLTWKKSTYDKENSTKKYDNLSAVTCNTNCSSCYMLNTGLGVICEYLWNGSTGPYLYTEDFGKTFRTMWAGTDSTSMDFVYINRNGYGLAGCHTSGQQKIYYTRDYGKTWTYTTTTTTDINCVFVEDNNDIGYAMGTNGYSGLQKVINLKSGTPTWSNFIPWKQGVRTLAMFDFDNYDGILPIITDGQYPNLFNTKTGKCENLTSDGLHSGKTVYSCNGFWMDKYGNIFHTQDRDIYINSNSWKDKKGTIKLNFGTNEIDYANLGNRLYRPICVLFDEQIILQQSATNRNIIYRIPYGIRNYNVKRNNKYYNCYKQLDISNSKVSSLSNEEYETIKEKVKEELKNYYKEKEKLYIGTISILPYNDKDHEKWLKCDGRIISKIEYSELYNKIGDIYNIGDEGEGYFRLPNINGKTLLGGNKELAGKIIEDSLPNIDFSANFIDNMTVFENDKRYGLIGLSSTINEEAIGIMGGLDTVGVNKTKIKIPHNSKSKETVGNMFEVSFYVKAK